MLPFVLLLNLAVSQTLALDLELIPPPQKLLLATDEGSFQLSNKLKLGLPHDKPLFRDHLQAFDDALQRMCNSAIDFESDESESHSQMLVVLDSSLANEQYDLTVSADRITIKTAGIKGLSHATSTLLQLIGQCGTSLPQMAIADQPSSAYRSFMIDLGRNPHSIECLRETIDLLWFYKVDSLHLHLTDDQRFAFPSKAYPKLQTKSEAISWENFQRLEKYAQSRGVTIIPELEVPGHSTILRKAYPDVFGKSPTELASLPSSRKAIKVLLDEMIEIFASSPYVHVGGDEAFGVPEDLQRDLINDLHRHLQSRGQQTVVWEGPGLGKDDNKVHEDVIHINWRTINFPADEMLAAGYRVVNAAWDPLYLVDHYPRNNFTMASPEHIFRSLSLNNFKHFNPDIRTFSEPIIVTPKSKVMGFCMPWWEGREVNYFPIVVPRLIPMASVAWNRGQARDIERFSHCERTSESTRQKCFYPVSIKASPIVLEDDGVFHHQTTITLRCEIEGDVRYTLDGSSPTPESTSYAAPFELEKSAIVRAALFVDGRQVVHGSRRTLTCVHPVKNLALGKPVSTNVGSGPPFSKARLTDGSTENLDYFLGYPSEPEPISITVDLQKTVSLNRVMVHGFFNKTTFEPHEIQLSTDGTNYHTVASQLEKPAELSSFARHDFTDASARYVRVITHGCKGNVFDSFSRLTEIQAFMTQ